MRLALATGFFALAMSRAAADAPISFHKEVAPIFRRNCNGCHRPGKTKGGLELTSFAALIKGGKHGDVLKAGNPDDSELMEQISGEEPEMPKDNDPLTAAEVATIARWIAEGAKDDTPADGGIHRLAAPPVYHELPAVSALAWSPDGKTLAMSGFHEILLHTADGGEITSRLAGDSSRIESLAFSVDGKLLAAAGGAPSEYGEVQVWNVTEKQLLRSIKVTNDSVFGVSFSPDGSRVAIGCADKTVRAFNLATGAEIMKCDNHIDWVFATAFTHDGARIVSASRDRALKLIELETGRLIDDVNRPGDPMLSMARHPTEDVVVSGDEKGAVRIHKMVPRAGRLKEGDDKEESFIRELERLGGPVHAVAFSGDGRFVVAASATGEAKVYNSADGKRVATLKETGGAVFAIALSADGQKVAMGGADGRIRLFDSTTGKSLQSFDAVPLEPKF